eukprot:scaffold312617_cov55-Attheya_sp.AAC.1
MSTNGWMSHHRCHRHHCERCGRRRQQRFDIMNSLVSLALVSCTIYYTARQIPGVDSTIVNDFSPTESYVVFCPCDKGFQYRSFR